MVEDVSSRYEDDVRGKEEYLQNEDRTEERGAEALYLWSPVQS
jgi:hypothetical protein